DRASGRMYAPDPVPPDPRPLPELTEAVPPPGALETIGTYLHAADTLGRRTAELHRALAAGPRDSAFAPEPFRPADAEAVRRDVGEAARKAFAALRDTVDRLSGPVAGAARQFLDEGPGEIGRLGADVPHGAAGQKIRCHGDYHLGQVLW